MHTASLRQGLSWRHMSTLYWHKFPWLPDGINKAVSQFMDVLLLTEFKGLFQLRKYFEQKVVYQCSNEKETVNFNFRRITQKCKAQLTWWTSTVVESNEVSTGSIVVTGWWCTLINVNFTIGTWNHSKKSKHSTLRSSLLTI